jgi:hypothetical protein
VWAQINAVRSAIQVRVSVRDSAVTQASKRLQRVVDAAISAVRDSIAVCVRFQHIAATLAWRELQRIFRALIVTVGHTIAIRVCISHTTAADARYHLEWVAGAHIGSLAPTTAHARCRRFRARRIIRAAVQAIWHSVTVRVLEIIFQRRTATACTRTGRLVCVVRAHVCAVIDTVPISISSTAIPAHLTAGTRARCILQGVVRATVEAVWHLIAISVCISNATTTQAWRHFGDVVRAAIHAVWHCVTIGVLL